MTGVRGRRWPDGTVAELIGSRPYGMAGMVEITQCE
jgi:hypothetical protein